MQTVEEILSSPDYFRCDRYRCTMRRGHCPVDSIGCSGCPAYEAAVKKRLAEAEKRRRGRPPTVSQKGIWPGWKRCSSCKQVKLRSEFYRAPAQRDGITSECKECRKAAVAAWRIKRRRQKKK